jgi:hypothetical protein
MVVARISEECYFPMEQFLYLETTEEIVATGAFSA